MTASPRIFALVRWKQLYFLGACICLLALAAMAWSEAHANDDMTYLIGAWFLGLSALITLIQFITRIHRTALFTVRDDGVDIATVGFIPFADMRRMQNSPAHHIVFTFVNAPVDGRGFGRARARRDGAFEKNLNCRGMNAPMGTALRTLQHAYKAYLMHNAGADQARKLTTMFDKEPFFT